MRSDFISQARSPARTTSIDIRMHLESGLKPARFGGNRRVFDIGRHFWALRWWIDILKTPGSRSVRLGVNSTARSTTSYLALVLCLGLGAQVLTSHAATAAPDKPKTITKAAPVSADGIKALLERGARGRRTLIAEVVNQTRQKPDSRDAIVGFAASLLPDGLADFGRAGEIGVLLATQAYSPARTDVFAAALSATRASTQRSADGVGTALPVTARVSATRSASVFDSWGYFPARIAPFTVQDNYGWAPQRTDLIPLYTDIFRREFGANWGNTAIGQAFALNLTGPNGLNGWRGRGVTIAVIDSGIDARFNNPNDQNQGFAYVHPDLAGRLDIRSRRVRVDGTFDLDIMDDRGSHGTHVAGTIAANLNGIGMMGIAPSANIIALKGVATGGDTVQSLHYAASQADVRIINGSYGPSASPGELTWVTGSLGAEFNAVQSAVAAGKVLVYATGNDFATAPIQAQNPTGVPLFPFIRPVNARFGAYDDGGRNYDFSALSRMPGFIVAVANLDHNFVISADSNRCGVAAAWCISAPGGGTNGGTSNGILSTVVQGLPSSSPNPSQAVPYIGPDANLGYAFKNGTSMATPHVSGVIAVLMEAYPNYSARDIIRLMFATADDLGDRGVDRIYGHGLVRLDKALAAGPQIDAIPDTFVQNIPAGQTQTWAAPISTDRELNVQGTRSGNRGANDGDLIIAGVAEFRGGVTISSGDLVVEGTLRTPTVTVGANARLLGDGLVFGDVVVNGSLKPGVGPSEMYVNGNVTVKAGGQFQADIDGISDAGGPGSYSRLVIFGAGKTFQAGGSFLASFRGQDEGADNTFTPHIGDRFRVVLAEDGARVLGRFARIETEVDENGVSGLGPNTRMALLYDSTSITLAVMPTSFANLSAHGINLSRSQSAVGQALDRMQNGATGAVSGPATEIFERLSWLGPQEISSALQQMSGSGHAASLRSAFASGQQFSGLIGDRIGALRSGGAGSGGSLPIMAMSGGGGLSLAAGQMVASYAPLGEPASSGSIRAEGPSVWGKLFGQWSRTGGEAGTPGTRASGGGLVIGGDIPLTSTFVLGAAASYARSRTTGEGLSGDTTSYLGAVYGSFSKDGFEVDALAGLTYSEFSTQRTMTFGGASTVALSSTGGLGLIGNAEVGHRFRFTAGVPLWVKPFIGLSYGDLKRSAFAETGAGAFGLSFPGQRFASVQGRAGLAFGATIAGPNGIVFLPEASLAWGRSLSDSTTSFRANLVDQPMLLQTAGPGRDAFNASVKLTAELTSRFRMFAGYSGEYRSNSNAHRVEGGARLTW